MKFQLNVKCKNNIFLIFIFNKIWFIQKVIQNNKNITFFYIFIILKIFGFIIKYK